MFNKRTFKKHLPGTFLPLLSRHIEAGTCFHPFFRFNLPVAIEVGTKVAMPADAAIRIVQQQGTHQHTQRMALPRGARIGSMPVLVQSALVADADAPGIVFFYIIYVSCYYIVYKSIYHRVNFIFFFKYRNDFSVNQNTSVSIYVEIKKSN